MRSKDWQYCKAMKPKGVERDQAVMIMEDWVSGLNQQFTKLSTFKRVREFESHILRQERLARNDLNMSKKINNGYSKYDWPVAFAQSYLLIAKLACQELLDKSENRHHKAQNSFTYNISDLYVPMVFNIKHGIEVFIKSLSIFIDGTYDEKTHDIKKLFIETKPRILKILKPTKRPYYDNLTEADVAKTIEALNKIEELITDFYHLDFLKSKVGPNYKFTDVQNDFFRYPENKTGIQINWEPVLDQLSNEDIEHILGKINNLYEHFNQVNFALSVIARNASMR